MHRDHTDDQPAPAGEPLVRTIPDPGFADDSGAADAEERRVLDEHRDGAASSGAVLSVLQDARLLVPVVAVLGEVEVDDRGLAHDKTSDMAAVLVRATDGSTGLLAFTSATAAVQDGAEALLVDLAGPVTYVVDGDDLTRLAAGWRLVAMGEGAVDGAGHGWIGPSAE